MDDLEPQAGRCLFEMFGRKIASVIDIENFWNPAYRGRLREGAKSYAKPRTRFP